MGFRNFGLGLFMALTSASHYTSAIDAPLCLNNDNSPIPVNNDEVMGWKTSTANEYHDRGNIFGTISKLYKNATDHKHFQVRIADGEDGTIEVVYSLDFGALPQLKKGMKVQACGDYITSRAPYRSYKASPDGAIIHWVHWSSSTTHPSGFVWINGELFGQKHSSPTLMTEALDLSIAK